MAEGKLTLPLIYALNQTADPKAAELARKVKQGKATPDEIAFLIAFAKENGGIDYAERRMNELRDEAFALIADFRNAAVKTALQQYIDFVIGRAH